MLVTGNHKELHRGNHKSCSTVQLSPPPPTTEQSALSNLNQVCNALFGFSAARPGRSSFTSPGTGSTTSLPVEQWGLREGGRRCLREHQPHQNSDEEAKTSSAKPGRV